LVWQCGHCLEAVEPASEVVNQQGGRGGRLLFISETWGMQVEEGKICSVNRNRHAKIKNKYVHFLVYIRIYCIYMRSTVHAPLYILYISTYTHKWFTSSSSG
jgi:hypothetical protein